MMKNEMTSFDSRVAVILESISQPAAPFYEHRVKKAIKDVLSPLMSRGVRVFEDRYGNLVAAWWRSANRHLPCLALAAHMDHPGFDPVKADGKTLAARILGGVPTGVGLIGSPVRVIGEHAEYSGSVSALSTDGKEVTLTLAEPFREAVEKAFGVFDFVSFQREPPFLHGPAMDDLAGCAIQTAVLERVVKENVEIDLLVIYHRAEEVGFLGAVAGCEVHTVPSDALVISIEASKHLDGARPGEGIVIRTGDRLNLFDPNAQDLLETAADTLLKAGIKTQKRRMDGGVCEASLFLCKGYEATAVSVPLINYHNHGESGPEPEAIHIYDLNSAAELIFQAALSLKTSNKISRPRFYDNRRQRFQSVESRLL